MSSGGKKSWFFKSDAKGIGWGVEVGSVGGGGAGGVSEEEVAPTFVAELEDGK